MYQRKIFYFIKQRLEGPRFLMEVLLGPRQIGKTMLAQQIRKKIDFDSLYITGDDVAFGDHHWLTTQWEMARQLAKQKGEALLVIDEIQKIFHWSEIIKKLWDEDSRNHVNLKVLMLGSSPWLIQSGLSESLAGRFEIIPMTHWSLSEMREAFGFELKDYIYFGGYPGAAHLIDRADPLRWKNYINDALIETTISRDILLMTQVNKPALLRRLFQLGCLYSGQILSYQKILGQLQDAGNSTTLANYLKLLQSAGLLGAINKYAVQSFRQRSSSPRFMVFNTALITAQRHVNFDDAQNDRSFWGHLVESAVGSYILNSIRGTDLEVFYWREGHKEVDFILKQGDKLIPIEVKSGKKKEVLPGLKIFEKKFPVFKTLLVGEEGIPVELFLQTKLSDWF